MLPVGMSVLNVLLLLTPLLLLGMLAKWAVEDAERRGKSPWIVSFAVVFFFPWGLLAWLILRPEIKPPPTRGAFDLEKYRVQ
jgi:hypothetical protein